MMSLISNGFLVNEKDQTPNLASLKKKKNYWLMAFWIRICRGLGVGTKGLQWPVRRAIDEVRTVGVGGVRC